MVQRLHTLPGRETELVATCYHCDCCELSFIMVCGYRKKQVCYRVRYHVRVRHPLGALERVPADKRHLWV